MSTFFHDVVSRKDRGPIAGCARFVFGLIEIPYSIAVKTRNRMFDSGLKKINRLDIPVVSVGNLTLGGTGKSPMVAFLASRLIREGKKPGLLSRGYAQGEENRPNDEAMELAWRLPDTPHEQDPDRFAGGKRLLEIRPDLDIAILDDGFQHRRLHRDLNIVLLDASEPFGYDRIFPRGLLREPVGSLKRADIVILSRADLVREVERKRIREIVRKYAPDALWGELIHKPGRLVSFNGEEFHAHTSESLDRCRNHAAVAFCGIGNPEGFRTTLKSIGVNLLDLLDFPDHNNYADEDYERIERSVRRNAPETIFCTMKDLVKIRKKDIAGVPLYAVSIESEFIEGEAAIMQKVIELAERKNQGTKKGSVAI